MTLTYTMNAPTGFGGEITGMPSGTTYTVPASGVVTGVAQADLAAFGALGFSLAPNTVSNTGTVPAGVTAQEFGNPYGHTTRLTLNTVLPVIAGGASLGLGILVYTFPAGAQIIDSASINVGITQTQGNINANTPNVGLGSVVASGAVSVLSGTATFQNIVAGTNAANCTGTPMNNAEVATSSPFSYITQNGGVKTVYFNVAAAWSAGGDAAALVTGTIILNWNQFS